jgi:serine/threonine-protein kinase RsbW
MALETCLHFVIKSDFCDESRQVQKRILEEVERFHYDPDAAFGIRISLEEALINAIKHGNRQDSNKKVRVEATISPEQIEIVIHDEGQGFDRTRVPDPTADENLERLHGRGILLIESYMDEVEWCDCGRCIRMVRKNRAQKPNASCQ